MALAARAVIDPPSILPEGVRSSLSGEARGRCGGVRARLAQVVEGLAGEEREAAAALVKAGLAWASFADPGRAMWAREMMVAAWLAPVARACGAGARRAALAEAGLCLRLALSSVPSGCGPAVAASGGRGPLVALALRRMVAGPEGWREAEGGWRGHLAARAVDALDRAGVAPALAERGRLYASVVEAQGAAGMGCASLEARRGGGGGDGTGWMEAVIARSRWLDAQHRRLEGVALAVRRVRPSARGPGARTITRRELVDAVCLEGVSLSEVLRRHGWAARGEARVRLRAALEEALGRMLGGAPFA